MRSPPSAEPAHCDRRHNCDRDRKRIQSAEPGDDQAQREQHPGARTEETSALVVWNGHEAVVVEQVPSPKQVKHTAALGTRYHTYQSASVQIFLAQLPPGQVQQLFERRLIGGPYDAGPPDGFTGELDRVRARGYAVNDGQTSVEEVGLAAPVYGHRGDIVAGVLLSAPRFRVPAGMLEPLGKAVGMA